MPAAFSSLPPELRLQIFENLSSTSDAIAFRQTNATNYYLIKDSLFEKNFLSRKEEALFQFFGRQSVEVRFPLVRTKVDLRGFFEDTTGFISGRLEKQRAFLCELAEVVRIHRGGPNVHSPTRPCTLIGLEDAVHQIKEGRFVLDTATSRNIAHRNWFCDYSAHLELCRAVNEAEMAVEKRAVQDAFTGLFEVVFPVRQLQDPGQTRFDYSGYELAVQWYSSMRSRFHELQPQLGDITVMHQHKPIAVVGWHRWVPGAGMRLLESVQYMVDYMNYSRIAFELYG
ncbi:hypothetical protein BJ508DRAFT_373975 [Ascobolus immersus RN42]|uniref:F-box domain-containing protein n=1 Tax=Ascobolus immersus RN42 TaxID=1160509 RepID=A0A3N4IGM8_ASCIM|nr:hypothetical protein BJ508DRAFT_373975 [Ascobolus immersus RN42]